MLEGETVFVAEDAGVPAGYDALDKQDEAVRVDQLFVSPEHEAQGVGRRLLEFAEGYAISIEASVLQIVVRDDDSRAVEFYRGRGFVPVGEELLELVLPQTS